MKKNFDLWVNSYPCKKLIMELKIAFLLVVVSVSRLFAEPSYSQIAKVSLSMENKSLEQVMDEIERQSEFYFIFNQKQINVYRIVSIQSENQLITAILPQLFKGTNVNYVVLDRKILLTTDPLGNRLTSIATEDEQQLKRITGTVTDKNGDHLPAVSVYITGTNQGTSTDSSGKYSIDVPEGARSLTFSFVGMEPQTIIIGTLTEINVTMVEAAIGLDEIVVVGYNTQKRKSITGATNTINSDAINNLPANNINLALQGRIPGVEIGSSGNPSSGAVVRIRGINSFNSGNDPLYIVDGLQ
ncbi:MAG: carboxypeptidase-like regulatory domain-containing protein, partial [Bacteroidia bacterium]|nr:carboxypeptidase-like regulatory domain-containing protein [Bacteroidia bacterium]